MQKFNCSKFVPGCQWHDRFIRLTSSEVNSVGARTSMTSHTFTHIWFFAGKTPVQIFVARAAFMFCGKGPF